MEIGFLGQFLLAQADSLALLTDVLAQNPAVLWGRSHALLPKQERGARTTVYMLYFGIANPHQKS